MGAELSLLTPTAPTVALQSYVDIIPNVQYSSTINSSRFLKTCKALDRHGFNVVKIFIKPDQMVPTTTTATAASAQYSQVMSRVDKQQQKLMQIPNTLPFNKIIETERANYLIRPFIKTNLLERLSIRPFYETIEKNWICFQMLTAINECHALGIMHGDLKTENIVVTSWNWCMITDFESFKPVQLPENSSQFSFYFDISKRNSCYLAPERFSDEPVPPSPQHQPKLTPAMDMFSLGCVIAELYLDGSSIFTLSQLFRYKRNEYTPNLNNIEDPNVIALIQDLIQLDPSKRLSAKQILQKYEDSIFPKFFKDKLYPFVKDLSCYKTPELKTERDRFHECDYRIDKLYNELADLLPRPQQMSNTSDLIQPPLASTTVRPLHKNPIPITLQFPNMEQSYTALSTSRSQLDRHALLLLSIVLSQLRNTTHSSFRIKSCDLIIALAERLPDEAKLDRCLPYLIYLLEDPCSDVQIASLRAITGILHMCDSVTMVNLNIWPEYILPKLSTFASSILKEDSNFARFQFAIYLPYLMTAASKFESFAIIAHLKMSSSPNNNNNINTTKNGGAITNDPFQAEAQNTIMKEFENFVLNLLTDRDANVRIALLQNISEICQFFGKDKTNDLILSHLITYLNDKDPNLRLCFIDSILPLSMFTGIASFEQYILPLLVQTINDPDELVVFKILQNFIQLVNLQFISKLKIWDLVKIVIKLLLHPNEWIRRHTLILIIQICDQLSLADLYCILYPIIRPFFQYDVTVFNFESLYPCLTRPLTRSVYRLSITWAQQVALQSSSGGGGGATNTKTNKSLFWQRQNNTTMDSFGNAGMSFMVKASMNNYRFNDSYIITNNNEIPISSEDKIWLTKLSNSGLSEHDFWKLATMRDYIFRISQLNSKRVVSGNNTALVVDQARATENSHMELQKIGVLPKTLFFDVMHKPTLDSAGKEDEPNHQQQTTKLVKSPSPPPSFAISNATAVSAPPPVFSDRGISVSPSGSLFMQMQLQQQQQQLFLGGKLTKAAPSIHEDREHAFAFGVDSSRRRGSENTLTSNAFIEEDNIPNVVSAEDESELQQQQQNQQPHEDSIVSGEIMTEIHHNYRGKNPYIVRFLQSFKFEPTLDDYIEFGPPISSDSVQQQQQKTGSEKQRNMINATNDMKNWNPKGVMVAHLTEHKASCNCICVSPDNSYFVSGDSDGVIKIWDSLRLERNVTGISALSYNCNSCIKSMCFIPDRDCIAVAMKNGALQIFKISFEQNGRNRFNKLILIRSFQLIDEYATQINICNNGSLLVMVTTSSRIIGIDIKTMNQVFVLQNELSHGLITSFVVDPSGSWLLSLTNHNHLDLWDLRFEIHLKDLVMDRSGKLAELPLDFRRNKRARHALFISDNNNNNNSTDNDNDYEILIIDVSKLPSSCHTKNRGTSSSSSGGFNSLDKLSSSSYHSNQVLFVQLNRQFSYMLSSTQQCELIYWNLRNLNESKYLLKNDAKIEAHETMTTTQQESNNGGNGFIKYTFNQLSLSSADEKKNAGSRYSRAAQVNTRSVDIINDIKFMTNPYEMIIVGDRSGCINVYR